MFSRAALVWLLLLVVAVLNGAFRDSVVSARFGELVGHAIGTVILSLVILITAWLTVPWIDPATGRAAWAAGAFWLLLTIAFEFIAGHYLFDTSWQELLADYDVRRGRVWVLVLLATLVAPPLAFRTKRRVRC